MKTAHHASPLQKPAPVLTDSVHRFWYGRPTLIYFAPSLFCLLSNVRSKQPGFFSKVKNIRSISQKVSGTFLIYFTRTAGTIIISHAFWWYSFHSHLSLNISLPLYYTFFWVRVGRFWFTGLRGGLIVTFWYVYNCLICHNTHFCWLIFNRIANDFFQTWNFSDNFNNSDFTCFYLIFYRLEWLRVLLQVSRGFSSLFQ